MDELNAAIKSNDVEEIDYVMKNLKHNTGKIEEHGKRADAIVRSMMQHARTGKSQFEQVNLNNLIEQYTDLAYHGKRTQIPIFYAKIIKDLQPKSLEINVVIQELGQVLLNLPGNSFDAVWDRKLKEGEGFEPEITVSTQHAGKYMEIRISDNGCGIPEGIRGRIFEPFFTTKPTGTSTGLGLSLSYDIITHGHWGSLVLDDKTENGTTFIISLPLKSL